MSGERAESRTESLRSVREDSHEIGDEQNHRVEIIYLPEGILTDRRRSGLHAVPADVVVDRRGKGSKSKNKNWSRRLNFAFSTFLGAALVLPAILTAYFGFGVHPVVSGSMRPTFQIGDLMISKIEPVSRVKVGDVVLLMSPITGEMQAHRVISKTTSGDSTTFVTKGDANPASDAAVKVGSVTLVRHITSVVPKLGTVITAFSSTIVRTITGISLIALFLANVFMKMVLRRRDDRKKTNLNLTNGK